MWQIKKLKEIVKKDSLEDSFIHNKWYVKYHLKLVEQIATELGEIYTDSDKNLVSILVWVHDYGKIIGLKNIEEIKAKIKELMKELKFKSSFIEKVTSYYELFERKEEIDLNTAPIEVKIVSSADGASHFIGPFYHIYFYENGRKGLDELMSGNLMKIKKDWERKIVLPEAKRAIEKRRELLLESNGVLPAKIIVE